MILLNAYYKGFKAMFLFQKGHTDMPRWLEIGYGIMGWLGVICIIYAWL